MCVLERDIFLDWLYLPSQSKDSNRIRLADNWKAVGSVELWIHFETILSGRQG
jgi:hypothetical protein